MFNHLIAVLGTKRGSEMVEASIAMPIIILAVVLLIRLFTFYIDILTTGIKVHEEALAQARNYNEIVPRDYSREERVEMLKGGLLSKNLDKRIKVECQLYNEDYMVRGSEVFKK